MSIERACAYLKQFGLDDKVITFEVSSATVELAAKALNCEAERIAKTLSFADGEGALLIVAAGDMRIDNHKFKEYFHFKPKMLKPEVVEEKVGYAVGGVCPFGVNEGVSVYLDESLKRFDYVYPACGSASSAIKMTVEELFKVSGAKAFIDIGKAS